MRSSLSGHQVSEGKISMHASICSCMSNKSFAWRRSFFAGYSTSALLAMFCLLASSGCGSNSSTSRLKVGPITFTDANGALQTTRKVLAAGESSYMDVNVTNDGQELGADWSVYCGSAPPPGTPIPPGQTQDDSCGTFIPVHTVSGPIPGYVTNPSGYLTLYTAPAAPPKSGTVTLYATATSNRSRVSTVTLMVDAQSISIAFAPVPPATLAPGASTQIKAAVNHDATNSGVIWSAACGSSDCGSFHPMQTASGIAATYTAPAAAPLSGGAVQITAASAADPNKSASYNIAIQSAATSDIVEEGLQ
jgi:hypothetical protein